MSSLWPWLAVAGAGALHGLNPCSGWVAAAACGSRTRSSGAVLRSLGPLALGHAASVGVVAAAVAWGLSMDALPPLAGVGLAGLLLWLVGGRRRRGTGLALSSFITTTLQGSGLMLVPALVPLCLSASPAREITASGSLVLALAAVALHMAAMLAVTGLLACAAQRGVSALRT
ncbi:MAG: hypothetical protein EOP39_21305 [Rubrivivax sp.]|nr:MAG: hypothetical protein EOP39_21305 [Rubrivivax sp.]